MAHRAEWLMQLEVARLLGTWLPADCFWSAIDATTTSPTTGLMRRLRGCRAGLPDIFVVDDLAKFFWRRFPQFSDRLIFSAQETGADAGIVDQDIEVAKSFGRDA